MSMDKKWHIYDVGAIEKELKTNGADGLTIREASARLDREKRKSKNRKSLFVPNKSSAISHILYFFTAPTISLLAVVALLAMLFGHSIEGLAVLAITVAGAVVGGFISSRASSVLESANEYASPMVRVKRGGNTFYTDGRNVVVGDVITVSTGDLLPCDARLVGGVGLAVKEIIKTSSGIRNRTVNKCADIEKEDVRFADASNMLFAGSAVLSGEGIAIVTATGEDVYLSQSIPSGALAIGDGDSRVLKSAKTVAYKITFICVSVLIILSLLSLITFKEQEFVSTFLMLLSATALITFELFSVGARNIFSTCIKKLSSRRSKNKSNEASASVRSLRTLDTLTGVTDILLVGDAGLYEGFFYISKTYTCSGILERLTPDTRIGNRILTYLHTYVKAISESDFEGSFISDGIAESIYRYLRICGFDISGASLVLKSLYYANDMRNGNGYAYAETTSSGYRVAIAFDSEILKLCKNMRNGDKIREADKNDIDAALEFCKKASALGQTCMYVITESDGQTVLEGIVTLERHMQDDLCTVVDKLKSLGIRTTALLDTADDEPKLKSVLNGELLYASQMGDGGMKIEDTVGQYRAYIGFANEDCIRLIQGMRSSGCVVAAYGVDNDKNSIMSAADMAISCDVIKYSSDKYTDAVYEKMVPEGRATSVRCSQQTRLLSSVIVKRASGNGGGLYSVLNSVSASRGAYLKLSQSLLAFAMLMSNILPIVAMSVIVGEAFLNSFQVAFLVTVGAFISFLSFSESEPKSELLCNIHDYLNYPTCIIKEHLSDIIVRISVGTFAAAAIKILDALGIFGNNANYTLPVCICLLLTTFAELLAIIFRYTKSGDGRRKCYLKLLVGYALLLLCCAVSTFQPFSSEFFPNGFGSLEFIIVPLYFSAYVIALAILHVVRKVRKKR